MRILCLVVGFLTTLAVTSAADVPEPPCMRTSIDETRRLLLVPDGSSAPLSLGAFSVTLLTPDCELPIVGASVEVLVGGQVNDRVRLCDWNVLSGTTDHSGTMYFNIQGGGCYKAEGVVEIRANGWSLRHFDVIVSPDYAGWDNLGQPGRASLSVTPVDLGAFVSAYHGGMGPESCHDYDNSGATDPADLAVFCKAYAGGTMSCDP
jgi:hypothetical protein